MVFINEEYFGDEGELLLNYFLSKNYSRIEIKILCQCQIDFQNMLSAQDKIKKQEEI